MSSPVLPLLISTRLRTPEEINLSIQRITEQLATYQNKTGFWNDWQRKSLQKKLDAEHKQLSQLQSPSDQSGVPPAPEASGILGPRIEMPKVGLGDLKINLPGSGY